MIEQLITTSISASSEWSTCCRIFITKKHFLHSQALQLLQYALSCSKCNNRLPLLSLIYLQRSCKFYDKTLQIGSMHIAFYIKITNYELLFAQ